MADIVDIDEFMKPIQQAIKDEELAREEELDKLRQQARKANEAALKAGS